MKLGARGQFFAASLTLTTLVLATSGLFLYRQLHSAPLAPRHADVASELAHLHAAMRLAAIAGLTVAVVASAGAAELLTQQLRSLVKEARRVARGKDLRISLEAKGELGKLAGSFNRITADLHKVEVKLGRERARLHTVLVAMAEGVVALDEEGLVRLANPAARAALGWREPPRLAPLAELTDVTALIDLAARALAGEATSTELELAAPLRLHFVRATPLQGVGGAVLVFHDVSEARRVEAMRRDFVANVSHELRTPVSVIEANAETLLAGGLDDREASGQFLAAIVRSSERLARLIDDLLDLSRIEAGHYSLHIEPIPVAEVLEGALEEIGVRAGERGIEVRLEPAAAGLTVAADGAALEHVLLNLLENAIKYTPHGGRISLYASERGGTVRLSVEDDGLGIAEEHRERVFERFYRVDSGRSRDVGGTGLGLSIVKHLAEAMSGVVGVDAAIPHGSIFWIELTRAPSVPNPGVAPGRPPK